MLFSIIVINYNAEQYLNKCLDSIFSQTLDKSKYEVIVVDDLSTDNSVNIIKEYDVKFFQTKGNTMCGGTRNVGMDYAKGEYILFMDSDDYLYNNEALEKLSTIVNGQDIIHLTFNMVYDDGRRVNNLNSEVMTLRERIMHPTHPVSVWSKCWKKELIKDIRFYEGVYYEDTYFTMHAYCKAKTEGYMTEPFYVYNRVAGSITLKKQTTRKKAHAHGQLYTMFYLMEDYPEYKKELLARIKAKNLIDRINQLIEIHEAELSQDYDKIKAETDNNTTVQP